MPCYSQFSSFSWQEGQRVPQLSPASFFARAGSPYPVSRSRMWLRPKPPRVIFQLGISPRLLCPSPKDSRRKGFVLAIAVVQG